jgi:hypothetical protein
VLELSRILAGPFATMQLADLGADVIKGEAPGSGDETRRWGHRSRPTAPLAIGVGTDRQFARLAAALQLPDVAADPRFAANTGRVAHREELKRALEARLARHPRAVWLERLAEAGVPAAPSNSIPAVFADPALRGACWLRWTASRRSARPCGSTAGRPALIARRPPSASTIAASTAYAPAAPSEERGPGPGTRGRGAGAPAGTGALAAWNEALPRRLRRPAAPSRPDSRISDLPGPISATGVAGWGACRECGALEAAHGVPLGAPLPRELLRCRAKWRCGARFARFVEHLARQRVILRGNPTTRAARRARWAWTSRW